MEIEDTFFFTAKPADIKEIMKIEMESFPEGIIEEEIIFQERIKVFSDGFLLVKKNGKAVGYISSEIWNWNGYMRPESFVLGHSIYEVHHNDGTELYISSMGTLADERKKGLGDRMVNTLINRITDQYPNVTSCTLIVSSQWRAARKIYLNNEFEEVMIIKDFFLSDHLLSSDGIVMKKKLKGSRK